MAELRYTIGDATAPQGTGPRIICHICNDIGGWGKGFVLAISKRWPQPEAAYRRWHEEGAAGGFALGAVQLVEVEPRLWVANMIAQHGIKPLKDLPPIRYAELADCLVKVGDTALREKASAHMPRIGCGLAGGTWDRVEPIIREQLVERGVDVTVYDFDPAKR
jgi:O-acetyl-ADP-ribose deacetylase (regulator of RNase III)